MLQKLKIALAQFNPTVGDVIGNTAITRDVYAKACAMDADLVVFSELFLVGYPPEDLVLKPALQDACERALRDIAAETAAGGTAILIGTPWRSDCALYNAVALLENGEISALRFKYDLPNYGVFDEKRIFAPGPLPSTVDFRGIKIGLPVCEDIWTSAVTDHLLNEGAEILLVINGSPYEDDKFSERTDLARARVAETGLPLIYVNQLGGQDELVFDGGSFVIADNCKTALQMPTFSEQLLLTDWHRGDSGPWTCQVGENTAPDEGLSAIYQAMVLGLRDYVNKNRFPGVLLGMSGGVDSALSAAVAVDALGPERVWCIKLPSKYTSSESNTDADECAALLGARLDNVTIEPAVDAFENMLGHLFQGRDPDITEENVQSRSRGLALMALSNKFGHMVLTTGNKSEMSVGYATIYGDMAGGYSVIKDVYKTTVFALCHWRNENSVPGMLGPAGRVIPENIITKPPSAELRPDQKDEDSLPPYDKLDDILSGLIEEELSVDEIVARGHERETVKRIEHLLYIAEYKRRQAPPGVKITRRNFGRDRRYPITNGFRDNS